MGIKQRREGTGDWSRGGREEEGKGCRRACLGRGIRSRNDHFVVVISIWCSGFWIDWDSRQGSEVRNERRGFAKSTDPLAYPCRAMAEFAWRLYCLLEFWLLFPQPLWDWRSRRYLDNVHTGVNSILSAFGLFTAWILHRHVRRKMQLRICARHGPRYPSWEDFVTEFRYSRMEAVIWGTYSYAMGVEIDILFALLPRDIILRIESKNGKLVENGDSVVMFWIFGFRVGWTGFDRGCESLRIIKWQRLHWTLSVQLLD